VTTTKFLIEFGLESLRDLPDLETLRDAGLLGFDVPGADQDGGPEARTDSDGPQLPEVSRGRALEV
jgi:segregation and condensation protein B